MVFIPQCPSGEVPLRLGATVSIRRYELLLHAVELLSVPLSVPLRRELSQRLEPTSNIPVKRSPTSEFYEYVRS